MTQVTMMWHGGSGYATPCYEDAERFPSITEAERAFRCRVNGDPRYPCCYSDTVEDGGPQAWIFIGTTPEELVELRDPYPDEVWDFGPRGGFRRSPA